jgi:4-hydroxy-tetrahydrodipicolinate reductase
MGQAILRLAQAQAATVLAALVRSDSPLAGQPVRSTVDTDPGDLRYSATLDAAIAPAVLIDFSVADAFDNALAIALARKIPFVSGTTALSTAQRAAMERAAETIPVLWSANFSIGVAVLARLAREAARSLAEWDCEIVEAHHRNKKDAPSGTALALGRAVADARGDDFERVAALESRAGPRIDASTIGFSVMRSGDIVGEHALVFAGSGERIELIHRATDRDVFAHGALRAAVWIAGQKAGLHTIDDVLGLRGISVTS